MLSLRLQVSAPSLPDILRRSIHTSKTAASAKQSGGDGSSCIGAPAENRAAVHAASGQAQPEAQLASKLQPKAAGRRVKLLVRRFGAPEWVVMHAPANALVSHVKERIVRKLQLQGLRLDEVALYASLDAETYYPASLVPLGEPERHQLTSDATLEAAFASILHRIRLQRRSLRLSRSVTVMSAPGSESESAGDSKQWPWRAAQEELGKKLAELEARLGAGLPSVPSGSESESRADSTSMGGSASSGCSGNLKPLAQASVMTMHNVTKELKAARRAARDVRDSLRSWQEWCEAFEFVEAGVREACAALQLRHPTTWDLDLDHKLDLDLCFDTSEAGKLRQLAQLRDQAATVAPASEGSESALRIVVASPQQLCHGDGGPDSGPDPLQPVLQRPAPHDLLPLEDPPAKRSRYRYSGDSEQSDWAGYEYDSDDAGYFS